MIFSGKGGAEGWLEFFFLFIRLAANWWGH